MQNLARFRSTSKFGGEYLRNGWRYSKSVSYSFDSDSSRVRRNKSSEDRSSNLGDLDVSLYPPKAHFSEKHISAPRGCCTPKFLHALENDQVLLAHLLLGTAAPLTTFFKGGQKLAFRKNIFQPLGGATPQIFTRAREWPSLTSTPPTGDRSPPYNFFQRGVKNWLKMQKMSTYYFGVRGYSLTKLWHLMCL